MHCLHIVYTKYWVYIVYNITEYWVCIVYTLSTLNTEYALSTHCLHWILSMHCLHIVYTEYWVYIVYNIT